MDALREDRPRVVAEPEPAAVPALAKQAEPAIRQLREAGLSGVLTYSDEGCRLHAVSLPDLEPSPAPSYEMCKPLVDSGGLGTADGGVVWSGLGLGVMEVMSQAELSRAIRRGLGRMNGFRAVQAVSLGDDGRFAVLAESAGEGERVVAVFDDGRLLFIQPARLVGGARSVRPSPRGEYYALLGDDLGRERLYSRDGRTIGLPAGIEGSRSVAWSPDDSWTAVANETGLYLFPSERGDERVVRIPLVVQDLDWAEAAPEP